MTDAWQPPQQPCVPTNSLQMLLQCPHSVLHQVNVLYYTDYSSVIIMKKKYSPFEFNHEQNHVHVQKEEDEKFYILLDETIVKSSETSSTRLIDFSG